jgi:hypothetical protein
MSTGSDNDSVDAVATDIVVAATEINNSADSDSSDEVCTTCILAKMTPFLVCCCCFTRTSLGVNIITIDMKEVLSLFRFEILLLYMLKRKY